MSTKFSMTLRSSVKVLQSKFPTPNYAIHTFVAICQQNHMKTHQADIMARGLPKRKKIDGVKHILLVASGKGGVGKSTTAVNIAVSLKNEDPSKQVGLLDADVFGPSIPLMMNLDDSPLLTKENLMVPLQNYGVKCMSMGFLVNKDSPVIWRGLMVMQALDRLLRQVSWDPVDYLVIDTPPGTGDTHLSLIQNVPISGALLVTTPQTAALQVTQRGANMFKKLDIPVLGIIQNMTSVECPKCQNEVRLHSKAANLLLENLGVPVLADIPLDNDISQGSDNGIPVVVASQESPQAKSYKAVAQKIIKYLNDKENDPVTNKL
ncbi:iron-sulfur protein NUBPL [Thrips palmi]|uniref:Iron-sulfur protein NUBPL n=1 Tax=Thrips palmi TaxID=161013 RepID=A0A6P8Y1Y1_THRPL|nr:iron-sulfur protein NUBPL [Thrips palmi]XP_034233539.1 iron-sulfur protein NUBPL [Thrips palmi]